jgi:nucleoside recognition membrane protein YjiH
VDVDVWQTQSWSRCFTQVCAARLIMNIIQLLITSVVIVGIVVIGLLAIIPALIDYPRGRDQDESDPPTPTPVKPDDHHDSIDLAA